MRSHKTFAASIIAKNILATLSWSLGIVLLPINVTTAFAQLTAPPGGVNPTWWVPPNSYQCSTCAPSTTAYTLIALCGTNPNLPGCTLTLKIQYYAQTNGHYHEGSGLVYSSHPSSLLQLNGGTPSNSISTASTSSCPTPSTITLIPSPVGQLENLIITDNLGNPTTVDYGVGYTDFVFIPGGAQMLQTGGNTTGHGDNSWNHYMNPGATAGFLSAISAYLADQAPNGEVGICINDMSLPVGGIFDIDNPACPSCSRQDQAWQPPHVDHSAGNAVDIATPGSGSCTSSAFIAISPADLVAQCKAAGGINSAYEPTKHHVHCEWVAQP